MAHTASLKITHSSREFCSTMKPFDAGIHFDAVEKAESQMSLFIEVCR